MSTPTSSFDNSRYEQACDQAIAMCDGNLRSTIKALINALDKHITYTDLDSRGYAILEVTKSQATCEFKRVQTQTRDGGQATSMAKFVLPSGSTAPQQVS